MTRQAIENHITMPAAELGQPPLIVGTPKIPGAVLQKSASTPAVLKHTIPRYDTFGRQCSVLRTAKYDRGNPNVITPKQWTHNPQTKTQSQLYMMRRHDQRKMGAKQIATVHFVNNAMIDHNLFGPDSSETEQKKSTTKSNYVLRSPFYRRKGEGGPPKSENPMKTRTDLLRHRRETLVKKNESGKASYEKMKLETTKMLSNLPETGREIYDSSIVKERRGRTQSGILAKRHDQARKAAKLLVKPTDLFDRVPNRNTPTLKYLEQPASPTKSHMKKMRAKKSLKEIEISKVKMKEQSDIVKAKRARNARVRTGVMTRTRSMVFRERRKSNLEEAKRFTPQEKTLVKFGTEVPWWKQAKANSMYKQENSGSSTERKQKRIGIRRPKSAQNWSYDDPFKKRVQTLQETLRRRQRRGDVAPKISQIKHSRSRPKSALPLGGNTTKRWTDAVIEFRQEEKKMGGKVSGADTWNALDKKGKKKRFEPGEQDPLYSSFAKDGIFRDPLSKMKKGKREKSVAKKRPQSARLPERAIQKSASTSAIPSMKTNTLRPSTSGFNTWVAGVLLAELLQTPFYTQNYKQAPFQMEFYNYTTTLTGGHGYNWTALEYATQRNGNCDPVANDCAHVSLEIWSGQDSNRRKYIGQDKTVEYGGPLGVQGSIGWFATSKYLDANPSLATYRGWKDASNKNIIKEFRKPMTLKAFCEARVSETIGTGSPTASHWCQWAKVNLFGNSSSFNVSATSLSTADKADLTTLLGKIYVKKCTDITNAALIPANFCTSGTGTAFDYTKMGLSSWNSSSYRFYPGFKDVSDNDNGYVISPECTAMWTDYDAGIASEYPNVKIYEATWNHMVSMHDIQFDWYSNGDEWPIVGYWWEPEGTLGRYLTKGDNYKLDRVKHRDWTAACGAGRVNDKSRCDATKTIAQRYNAPTGVCDYPFENLYKIVTPTLRTYNDEAYELIRNFQVSYKDHLEYLADLLGYTGTDSAQFDRDSICTWIRNNNNTGASWQQWIPLKSKTTQCLMGSNGQQCSSQGSCTANASLYKVGDCVCDSGYMGVTCGNLTAPVSKYVRQSDPLGLAVIVLNTLIGVALATTSSFFTIGLKGQNCLAFRSCLSLGITTFYGSLLSKTYKIIVIFNNKKLSAMKISTYSLLSMIGTLVLINLVMIIAMAIADAPTGDFTKLELSNGVWERVSICSFKTSLGNTMDIVLTSYIAFIFAIALYMAYSVRSLGVSKRYNNSNQIFLCTVVSSFLGIICAMISISADPKNYEFVAGVAGIGIALTASVCTSLLMLPIILKSSIVSETGEHTAVATVSTENKTVTQA
eukprot:g232.t1